MLENSREPASVLGYLIRVSKHETLEIGGWGRGSLLVCEEVIRNAGNIPRAPPLDERLVGPNRDRDGEALRLEERLRNTVSDEPVFVVASPTRTQPGPVAVRKK